MVVDVRENTARDVWRSPEQGEKAVNVASRLDYEKSKEEGEGEGKTAEEPRKPWMEWQVIWE